MLIRLDEGRLDKMKWRARDAFAPARHGHALEALARGLGANTYAGLRACAADYGGILWDGDESRALAFLAERGITVASGRVAEIVAGHRVEHEQFCHGDHGGIDIPQMSPREQS
jgi:hypothetical protein